MLKKRAASFWLNAMFYTMLQRVSLFGFGVAGYMILVRGFSTPTNGVWSLFITMFSLFELVKQGLIRNATIKFLGMMDYRDRKEEIQTSSLFISTFFSLIVIAIIFAFGEWIAEFLNAPNLDVLLLVSSINILLLIPYNHFEILLQSSFRFNSLFTAAFIRQGIFFIGLAVLYFFLPSFFTLLNILVLQIAGIIAGLFFISTKVKAQRLKRFVYSAPLTYSFFHFGKYAFGTNLFSGIARTCDHFITAIALGDVQGKNYVAYYNTVARINNMVDVPALAATDVLYPKNVEALETEGKTKVKYYFEQVTGTVVAFVVPVSVVIFILPKLVIDIIAGPEYYPAITILQITILFSMVRPLSYQFGSTLDAIGKPKVNFIANTLLMMLNIILTYVFLKNFEGFGAAYAVVVYYVVSLATMIVLLKKYVDVDARNIIRVAFSRYGQVLRYLINKSAAG